MNEINLNAFLKLLSEKLGKQITFSKYEEKSGDKEIHKFMPLVVGWIGIVRVYPRWFPDHDVEIATRFINHIKEIVRKKEFIWND